MDTFVDSAWYWLRFTDPHCTTALARREFSRSVDVYVGGIEHAVLHLLYARFIARALHSVGEAPSPEPFVQLVTQGMVVGKTYRRPHGARPLPRCDVIDDGTNAIEKATGEKLFVSWEKMSKSKYNGIDPRDIVTQNGADCTRLYVLFKAPIALELAWDEAQVRGQSRFLTRIWRAAAKLRQSHLDRHSFLSSIERNSTSIGAAIELLRATTTMIDAVQRDAARLQFNTAIAALMSYVPTLLAAVDEPSLQNNVALLGAMRSFVILLSPFAPHIAFDLWQDLCRYGEIDSIRWSGDASDVDVGNQLAPNVTMLRAHIVQLSDELQQLATSSSSSTSTTSIANGDVVGVVVQIDGRVVGGNFSVTRSDANSELDLQNACIAMTAIQNAIFRAHRRKHGEVDQQQQQQKASELVERVIVRDVGESKKLINIVLKNQ